MPRLWLGAHRATKNTYRKGVQYRINTDHLAIEAQTYLATNTGRGGSRLY